MPTYFYKARDEAGKSVKGKMGAVSQEALVAKLSAMGYMATRVEEVSSGISIEPLFREVQRISSADKMIFYVQLANMINAGLNILVSLKTLNRQTEHQRLKEIIGCLSRSVEAGDSFSEAVSRYPRVFSRLFVSMVRAGEASGKLDVILMKFAEFTERQEDLRQKITGALLYPLVLLGAGVAVTLFIVTSVIPQFAQIFLRSGIALPTPTLILYNLGVGIKQFWALGVLLAVAGWLSFKGYGRTDRGRFQIDRWKLAMPILGPLYRKTAILRCTRTLATLLGSGVAILESLDIVRGVLANEVLGRLISQVRQAVERGERMSEALRVSTEFPPDVVQMISAGEESGNLDGMLAKISDFYDMSLGHTIKKLTTVLEPLLLAFMGVMVGFIMASMLLPIFDMVKVLGH